jgi:hypothetical protein
MLIPLGLVLATAAIFVWLSRRGLPPRRQGEAEADYTRPLLRPVLFKNPRAWLAIKSDNPLEIQAALRLHRALPCSWSEGVELTAEDKLFISPPIAGWILVFGASLPEPAEDVDRFYRFVVDLSRRTGLVQYFHADRAVAHHAWVKVMNGEVVRAYAWADETLWTQGDVTQAERDLKLFCLPYGAKAEARLLGRPDRFHANCEKVGALAARWSVDPKSVDETLINERLGIAGELSHPKPH